MKREFKSRFPVEAIKSWLYEREIIDKSDLGDIQRSIKRSGVITPIIVRRLKDGSYQGLGGYLRTTACKGLGISEVPAVIYSGIDDLTAMDITLIDNIQHSEMSDWDIAKCLQVYRDQGLKLEEIASRIQKSISYISQKLAVLKDSQALQEAVSVGEISEKQARYIRRLPEELHEKAIEQVKGRTVEETRNLVKEMKEKEKATIIKAEIKEVEEKIKELDELEKRREELKSKVSEIEGKLKALQISNRNMNGIMKTVETLEREYFPLIKELHAYEEELRENQKLLPDYPIDDLLKDRKALDGEIGRLDVKINKLTQELKKLKKERDKVKKQRKIIQEKISEYNERTRKVRELTKLTEELKKKKVKLEGKLGDAIKDYEKLKNTLAEYEKGVLEERMRLHKELNALKREIFSLNGRINNRKNLEKKLKQLKEELALIEA